MVMKVIITMRVWSENNEQQHLRKDFANSCYKIVSPILLPILIVNFDVCKRYSGTLLLVKDVSHSFWNENYIFSKKNHTFLIDQPRRCRFIMLYCIKPIFLNLSRNSLVYTDRSSHRRWFVKKGVLRTVAKFTRNTCARVLFLIKL